MPYQPPYTLTTTILNRVAAISARVAVLTLETPLSEALRLRRINQIRTIQGSLAIEGNRLTEEQVTAVLEGRRVIAPPRELHEVRNAILAYEQLPQWQATCEEHLLAAHQQLMGGLIDPVGCYRSGGVGVLAGREVIHLAPPAARVPYLMADLFGWLATTDLHPLVASSVFHYEFEFIHPFADGNGRLGRLWQSLMLCRWNPLFRDIPVESLIYQHQADYYQALQQSTQQGDAAPFIEFILAMIGAALEELTPPVTLPVTPQATPQVAALLQALSAGSLSRAALQQQLGLRDRQSFRHSLLQPALAAGLIEMTHPDRPNTPQQHYRLTAMGRRYLAF